MGNNPPALEQPEEILSSVAAAVEKKNNAFWRRRRPQSERRLAVQPGRPAEGEGTVNGGFEVRGREGSGPRGGRGLGARAIVGRRTGEGDCTCPPTKKKTRKTLRMPALRMRRVSCFVESFCLRAQFEWEEIAIQNNRILDPRGSSIGISQYSNRE
jgi:hypothetical protein